MTTENDFSAVPQRPARLVRRAFRTFAGAARPVPALAAALQLVLGSAAPALAQQRRRAEPEANPQFQQQLQAPSSGGGGPMEEAPAQSEQASEPAPSLGREIQIGAAKPERQAASSSATPLDSRVTVRVRGAPLATFLDTISAQAKINFIITEGLETRRVTAFLQNVTVREALQVLLEMKGLTYQQVGKSNTYIVTPRSKSVENVITRIYTLSYIPLIPIGSASSEQASITPTSNSSSNFGGGAGGGSSGGPSAQSGGAGGGSAPAAPSDVAIINVLRSILSKLGQVAVEPRTNALIVTDIPEVFPQVEQIIAELDKKAPQVMIEAQIVEIDSSRAKNLGLEWGGANGELATFSGGARDTSFPLNLPKRLSDTHFLDPLNPNAGIISSLGNAGSGASNSNSVVVSQGGYLKTSILDLSSLQIVLRALVSRSEARFLGKPKILTLNNKSAIIQVASNQAISIQQSLSTAGTAAQAATTAERVSTGLVLRVTPQINKDGYITMLVQPSFTDVQESAISSASNRIFDPISRAASTLVRVKNGQTLVLGGLLESTETKVVRKVPFLGYIPLIGWLFTSTSSTNKNSDLVIFITPTIVSD